MVLVLSCFLVYVFYMTFSYDAFNSHTLNMDLIHCIFSFFSLCGCRITAKQCLILTSDLCLNLSHLRELDLSRNKIENKGVQILCDVLKDSRCKLERLRSVTKKMLKII